MKPITRRQFLHTARTAAALGAMAAVLPQETVPASACFDSSKTAAGYKQTVLIKGMAWGPVVTATILELGQKVRAESVRAKDFLVTESKENFDWASFSPKHIVTSSSRMVVEAYTCNKEGERTFSSSKYVRLEMGYDPNTGSPFCYDGITGKNTWCNPYQLKVRLAEEPALANWWGQRVTQLEADPAIDFSRAMMPELEPFKLDERYTGSDGRVLKYAYYKPSVLLGQKVPLVIWLHGAGEGGADTSIPLLGNQVTALAQEGFQQAMGGKAYVLVPQAPGFWMEYNDAGSWSDNPGTLSVYTQTLKGLIDKFLSKHPTIDRSRIYIGGCSNGGYMTMNMVMQYPEFFAAAYPICEAYKDSGITDGQLESLRGLPMWFVYAQNDTTVPPAEYAAPTIARLNAMGMPPHTSVFADVHDTSGRYTDASGAPYQYMGHWSWIYFFRNECTDAATGESLWTWLGQQKRG